MADTITADIAALVFVFSASAASVNAENSRLFACRGAAGQPICTPFMPDKCPIFACFGAILELIRPEFAAGIAIAIASPAGAEHVA